jgi:hypothetical protein
MPVLPESERICLNIQAQVCGELPELLHKNAMQWPLAPPLQQTSPPQQAL